MYEYLANLQRVVDGDTYDLSVTLGFRVVIKERFRLFGADTPEVYGARASDEGRAASDFVKRLLWIQPAEVRIKTYKSAKGDKKGKYGRYLVDIFLVNDEFGNYLDEPRMLSEYLIEKGHAKVYP